MAQIPDSLTGQVMVAYRDFGASMRALLDRSPSDAQLIGYLMVACFIGAAGAVLWAINMSGLQGDELVGLVMTEMVSHLFFLPLFVLMLVVVVHIICRAFGGQGSWYETRAALCWTTLVAAFPSLLATHLAQMSGMFQGALTVEEHQIFWGLFITSKLCELLHVYILIACLCVSHGFTAPRRIFLGFVVTVGCIMGGYEFLNEKGLFSA